MKWIFGGLRAMVVLYLVAVAAVVIFSKLARGPRTDRIRRFNRDALNPWMMRHAGGEHWYASVVRHIGRASGKEYATPVLMHRVDGHLVIPLPYGTDVDWLENLRNAGRGAAVHKGIEYRLADPVLVSRDEIAGVLGRRDAIRYRVFGIDDFVKLAAERVRDLAPVAV